MLEAIQQFLPLIVIILGAPLVLWLTLLAKKVLTMAGISETTTLEALVTALIGQAVMYAEQEASKLAAEGKESSGSAKLQLAIDFILLQLRSLGLAEIARDELVRRIEASVGELNNVE
ncbi:MAG: hypothetical protein HOM01_15425 [Kordiimonadaceae bacterium]|jgi:hypothetical protein|nr:hypothetical protein [Kordiimonadaceae bacterium]